MVLTVHNRGDETAGARVQSNIYYIGGGGGGNNINNKLINSHFYSRQTCSQYNSHLTLVTDGSIIMEAIFHCMPHCVYCIYYYYYCVLYAYTVLHCVYMYTAIVCCIYYWDFGVTCTCILLFSWYIIFVLYNLVYCSLLLCIVMY